MLVRQHLWPGGILRVVGKAKGPNEEGAALVETAIATSIVLMLLLGVFDFSLALYTYHYVSDAAREGSRWAMVRGSSACSHESNLDVCQAGDTTGATAADVSAYVAGCGASTSSGASLCGSSSAVGLSYPGIDSTDNMTVNTSWSCAGTVSATGETWSACGTGVTQNAAGNQVQVQVIYNFPLSIPFLWQNSIKVTSTSSMVISQ